MPRPRYLAPALTALALCVAASALPGPGRAIQAGAQAEYPGAPAGWHRFTAASSALPSDDVRFVSIAPDGTAWLRVADPDDGPDRVVAVGTDGRWRVFASQEAAVEALYDRIVEWGSLADFWAVDPAGRVWTGARFFHGAWRVVADDAAELAYGTRAMVDPQGTAWVTFGTCPRPDRCGVAGLAALDPGGPLDRMVRFRPATDAGQYGVADAHLLVPRTPTGVPPRAAWAVSRRDLYLPPDTTPVAYPHLELLPPPEPRNAGYATAAGLRPDGRLTVVTWVELEGERAVEHRVFLNTWDDGGWGVPEDITDAPLFRDGAAHVRAVAATVATDPAGGDPLLWLASSRAEVAVRRTDRWVAFWSAEELDAGRVNDMAAGHDGSVWVATKRGLLLKPHRPPLDGTAHLPLASRGR